MNNGYRVVDAQRHVIEPAHLWNERLAAPYSELLELHWPHLEVRGRPVVQSMTPMRLMEHDAYRQAYEFDVKSGSTAEYHLADMDRRGIDVAIILPTMGMYAAAAAHISSDLAMGICRAYNDWLHEWCAAESRRLKGLAILPMQVPDAAAIELRRAVTELGLVGALIRPNPLVGRQVYDRDYDHIYGEAESLGVPIVLSQLRGSVLPEIGTDRFDGVFAREACAAPFEMMLAFVFFMGHNLLERFPALRIGYTGAGAGWVGYWLDRADEHWGGPFGADAPSTSPPSHLFRTQGFAVIDPWETGIADVAKEVGSGNLLWGTHYPLPESLPFRTAGPETIANDTALTSEEKQAILWNNADEIFRISI